MTDASHPRRWLILSVLATSLLLIAMDATVLNVALPSLAADLDPGATELLWIVDVYGLVLAGLLIAMGGLGDRIGRRRLLLIGLVVFGVASGVVALAGSPGQLIVARALLGVGGAMIMPSTLSLLRNIFRDPRERTIAIGIWSAVASGGFALGPLVGGAILEVAPWGWVFAINMPIVAMAALLVVRWVPESRNPRPGPWDMRSVLLSVAGMLTLVWGIKQAGEHGLGEPDALLAMVAGVAALGLFVRRQARTSTPILDVRLFADRRFAGAAMAVLFVFFGWPRSCCCSPSTSSSYRATGRWPLACGCCRWRWLRAPCRPSPM